MTNSPVYILFLVALIGLGIVRMWNMFKVMNMIPEARRKEVLSRMQSEGANSGTDWDQVIGPGATQRVRLNRTVTQLGLYVTGAFIIYILATLLLK